MDKREVAAVRGFHYTPGYAATDIQWWADFRADEIAAELARGRAYFPSFGTVRVFCGYHGYLADPDRFSAAFEAFLRIAADHALVTIPTLFNRWHTGRPDFGGIYVDHFLPGSYVQYDANPVDDSFRARIGFDKQFGDYLRRTVGEHADDPRVSMWDLCNEPFFGPLTLSDDEVSRAELAWLGLVAGEVRGYRPAAPITIGTHALHGVAGVARVAPLCDVLSTHPYVDNVWYPDRAVFLDFLDELVEFAASVGKPLLASETVWGSLDDAQRVDTLRFTLDALTRRGIGFLCYGLNHSVSSDLHRPAYGTVGSAGTCAFIEADGTLRAGHEAFNDFAKSSDDRTG